MPVLRLSVVYLGVLTTAFTNWLQTIGQQSIPATTASAIYALDPILSSNESPGPRGPCDGPRGTTVWTHWNETVLEHAMRTGSPIRHCYFCGKQWPLLTWPMSFGRGSSIFKLWCFFVAKPCTHHQGFGEPFSPTSFWEKLSCGWPIRTRIQVILHSMFLNHGCHQHLIIMYIIYCTCEQWLLDWIGWNETSHVLSRSCRSRELSRDTWHESRLLPLRTIVNPTNSLACPFSDGYRTIPHQCVKRRCPNSSLEETSGWQCLVQDQLQSGSWITLGCSNPW